MAIGGSGLVAVGKSKRLKRLTAQQCRKMASEAESVDGYKECWVEKEPPETGMPCPLADAVERGGWEVHPDFKDATRHIKLRMPYKDWAKRQKENTEIANSRVKQTDALGIEDGSIKGVTNSSRMEEIDAEDVNPNG